MVASSPWVGSHEGHRMLDPTTSILELAHGNRMMGLCDLLGILDISARI